jgi:hypothetical protein
VLAPLVDRGQAVPRRQLDDPLAIHVEDRASENDKGAGPFGDEGRQKAATIHSRMVGQSPSRVNRRPLAAAEAELHF